MNTRISRVKFAEENHMSILDLTKQDPSKKIGVSVNRLYIQMAKYCGNPDRDEEVSILRNALIRATGKMHIDSSYAVMTVGEVIKCFDKDVCKLTNSAIKIK